MFSENARQVIWEELERGDSARSAGNEGRARVCARRAAGAASREYLRLCGDPAGSNPAISLFELLGEIQRIASVPVRVKEAAQHLVLKVDLNHNLPEMVDLLADARILISELEQLV